MTGPGADTEEDPMLNTATGGYRKAREPIHPAVTVGFLLFIVGMLGWLWTGEWRWAVTGTVLFFACLPLANTAKPPAK